MVYLKVLTVRIAAEDYESIRKTSVDRNQSMNAFCVDALALVASDPVLLSILHRMTELTPEQLERLHRNLDRIIQTHRSNAPELTQAHNED